ncbi:MAG TPA: DUF6327 family protein [Aequorivita sp.]|nr:DUF6327 family protein [Aequorivita sp.]
MKRYTTFEEIDRDLKYLRLKAQIDLQEVKIGFRKSKEIAKNSFSPMNLIASTVGSIIKRAFVLKVIDKLIGIRTVKHK